jgi:hypothetical protein
LPVSGFRLLLALFQVAAIKEPPGPVILSLDAAGARVLQWKQQQKYERAQRERQPPATGRSKPAGNAGERRGRLRCDEFSAKDGLDYG